MYKQITIQTLHKQGVTKASIARQIGCHRNTVNNILERNSVTEKQTREKSSIFDPYREKIEELLKKKVTRVRIHEILTDEHSIHSAYDTLRKYIKKHLPKPVEAFGVQITDPGDEAELDFGYLGMLPGVGGKLVKTWGLAVVLSYSRADYFAICYDQKLETLIKELKEAFSYFGGVPKRLKVDNMKVAVLKNRQYELEFNEEFLEFAQHYNTIVVPCTPYSPEQKGKVESGIKYLQQNFVNGRTFTDNLDIAAKLKDWMTNHANQRIHGTTKKVPWVELVNAERKALQPLPTEEFSLFERCIRKVGLNCHIHFENNYYSVPCQYVGKEVTVRWNDHLIRIISEGKQVALHTRSFEQGKYITERSHMPEHKRYSETEHQAKYEEKMREIGEDAHEYFRYLLQDKQRWRQTVRGVLGLYEQYGKEAVNLSLKRAQYYQVSDMTTIRHILEKQSYLLPPEPILPKVAEEEPIMGRNLGYYVVVYDANSVPNTA